MLVRKRLEGAKRAASEKKARARLIRGSFGFVIGLGISIWLAATKANSHNQTKLGIISIVLTAASTILFCFVPECIRRCDEAMLNFGKPGDPEQETVIVIHKQVCRPENQAWLQEYYRRHSITPALSDASTPFLRQGEAKNRESTPRGHFKPLSVESPTRPPTAASGKPGPDPCSSWGTL